MNRRCPNCENEAQAGDRYCPQCGMDMLWRPSGRPGGMRASDWLLTIFGVLAVIAATMIAPIGLPIMLIVYFAKRGTAFGRGIEIGCGLLFLLALGGLAVCLVGLSQMGR